jgi:hypothetical protein
VNEKKKKDILPIEEEEDSSEEEEAEEMESVDYILQTGGQYYNINRRKKARQLRTRLKGTTLKRNQILSGIRILQMEGEKGNITL